ncbi:IclR family transcriptional regulator C-terminal domain-containing protein [Streptomyces sp. NPDC051018]|uniref:IclR family transcriptional regulator domain-containing protein n=1 Tax=Streptomyces sp. NPDC051018 TaxID=3365639 RepID=UPI0037B593AF
MLLSQLTDDQVRSLYPGEVLTKVTPWTLDRVSTLVDELRTIREQGYATNRQGVEVGLAGVSVPLPGRSWHERIALCATVPLDRGDEASLLAVRQGLTEAASGLRRD